MCDREWLLFREFPRYCDCVTLSIKVRWLIYKFHIILGVHIV